METVPVKLPLKKPTFRCHTFNAIIRMCPGLSKETEKELVLHSVLIHQNVSGWIKLKPTNIFPTANYFEIIPGYQL